MNAFPEHYPGSNYPVSNYPASNYPAYSMPVEEEEEEEVYVWSSGGKNYVAGKDPTPQSSPAKSSFGESPASFAGSPTSFPESFVPSTCPQLDSQCYTAEHHMAATAAAQRLSQLGCPMMDPTTCFVPEIHAQSYSPAFSPIRRQRSAASPTKSPESGKSMRYVAQVNPKLSPSVQVSKLNLGLSPLKKPSRDAKPKRDTETEKFVLSDTEDDGEESVYDRASWVLDSPEKKHRALQKEDASAASTADDASVTASVRETDESSSARPTEQETDEATEDDASAIFTTERSDGSGEQEADRIKSESEKLLEVLYKDAVNVVEATESGELADDETEVQETKAPAEIDATEVEIEVRENDAALEAGEIPQAEEHAEISPETSVAHDPAPQAEVSCAFSPIAGAQDLCPHVAAISRAYARAGSSPEAAAVSMETQNDESVETVEDFLDTEPAPEEKRGRFGRCEIM
jgi:hypothetical protein